MPSSRLREPFDDKGKSVGSFIVLENIEEARKNSFRFGQVDLNAIRIHTRRDLVVNRTESLSGN